MLLLALVQAEQEDEACTNIGNLFDESITEATDSANFQDFGAADEAELTGIVPAYHILPQLALTSALNGLEALHLILQCSSQTFPQPIMMYCLMLLNVLLATHLLLQRNSVQFALSYFQYQTQSLSCLICA